MGTEVLRPQDVLIGRFSVHTPSFQRRRNFPANQINKKAPPPKPVKRKLNADTRRKDEVKNAGPVMGKVTLLRRGESLSNLASKINSNAQIQIQKSADDLDVKTGSEQIRLNSRRNGDVYAGTACFASPSPRSVPLPSFFSKKTATNDEECETAPLDDGTIILKRLMGLDLD